MAITLTTLTATWTDNNTAAHQDAVPVIAPVEVPDPDVPVVILLHGMGGSSNDLSQPGLTGFTYDLTAPVVSPLDLGLQPYPAVGFYGLTTDSKLTPLTGWQSFLAGEGYITVTYSQTEPWGSLAQVNGQPSDPVRQLHAIVTCIATTFPGRRIAFVTHSRGGLLLRAWLVQHGSDPAIRPRLGSAVLLAPPNQGCDLANIVGALEAAFAAAAALASGLPSEMLPLYQVLAGQIGGPAIADMAVGSGFLTWLADYEPGTRAGALLELHTFGGTSPTLFRWHLYIFTAQCTVPIITWDGSGFVVSFHWSVWDVGFPVRNYAGDVGAVLHAPPEIVPGSGDILVTANSASLPWQAGYHVHPLNHGQPLWDPGVQGEALPVLGNAWGSPPVQVAASWAVWSQPASVAAGTSFSITVTVTNVGTTTWPAGCLAGSDDGAGNRIWGTATATIAAPVPRGASVTVTLSLTAPWSQGSAQLSVFVAQPDDQQLERGQPPQAILVVAGAGGLAAGVGNGGNLQVVTLGTDHAPSLIWQDHGTGAWHWGGQLPGTAGAGITAVATGTGNGGNLQVIALGADGLAYLIWQDKGTGTWSWYGALPQQAGITFSALATGTGSGGNLQVIALGTDGIPYLIWQDAGSGRWSWYGALPHQPGTGLSCVVTAADVGGNLQVVCLGTADNAPYLIWQDHGNGSWHWYGELPHPAGLGFRQAATGIGNAGNLQVVCAAAADGQLYLIWQDAPSGSWSWGGALPIQPGLNVAALATGAGNAGNLQVVCAAGESLYLLWQDRPTGRWNWYGQLPDAVHGITLFPRATGTGNGTNLQVIAAGTDGATYLIWQDAPSGRWNWYGQLPTS